MSERVLVTGVLGCLGAWVSRVALERGAEVVGFDLGDNRSRLQLVLGADEREVGLVRGDITDLAAVERALDEQAITRVVHLAALQVPFVRANPSLGMRVNVQGTTNLFDAVSRRLDRIPGLVYASSAAVYHPDDPSPAPESGGTRPATLYGVSKLADEGVARVYAADHGLPSTGFRPYVVYGAARDQGMTSGPTAAIAAALRGERATIAFSGTAQFDYARDVATAMLTALEAPGAGAAVFNTAGVVAGVDEFVAEVRTQLPGAEIAIEGEPLPFPTALEAVAYDRAIGSYPRTSLADGIAETIALLSDETR
ncbi:MAG: NAD(P)-dependent oxidoreductase [Gaiellales bacterium]